MDITTLSRIQFALTTVYHFFFVPLTLGLSVLVAIMETNYLSKRDEVYKKMAKFWGNLFIINFALGVVTGIVMEFQFGMNWSEYARYVGDIFGAPLAIEALLAFFLESVFLGVWIFGWDRVPKGVHLAAIWLVAIASNLSAFWILTANAFMQHPVAYQVLDNGRIVMNNFWALISNPYLWLQFPHTMFSGFTTAAFFVLGISAYHLVRKKEIPLFTKSFRLAAIVGLISIIAVILLGHRQGQMIARYQPMKTASEEALWHTEDPASFAFISIVNQEEQEELLALRVPYFLSILMYNRPYGAVQGISELQEEYVAKYGSGNYIPNVMLNFWSFRIMVGIGFFLLLSAFIAVLWLRGKKPLYSRKLLVVFPYILFLPYISNTAGWLLAEVGRQPWVVFGLLKTQDAVSPNITTGMVLTSLIGFGLLYAILIAADVHLLAKYARQGAETEELPATEAGA